MSRRPVAIHQRPGWDRAPRGRLLLVAYHFPPAQTAGALRWERLTRYAAERGWGIDVVTLDPASLDLQDPSTLAELPDPVRVFGVPDRPTLLDRCDAALNGLRRALAAPLRGLRRGRGQESPDGPPAAVGPHSLRVEDVRFEVASTRAWIRAYQNVLHAVHDRAWALRAAGVGRAILEPGVHRAVIGCSPPNMLHEGTRRLARSAGLPLIVDMRDPWSLVVRVVSPFASPVFFWIANRFEARAVRDAALVVMNTPLVCRLMHARYPEAAERIVAIPNGCDEGFVARSYTPDDPFRIAFAGSIYLDRNPTSVFQALSRVVRELDLSPADIEIAFMGSVESVDGRPLEALAAGEGVGAHLRVLPRGTRREAEQFLASAHVLLNLAQDSHVALPSKLFEYMRHEAALLVLAEPGSATHELMRGTDADLAEPHDVDAIAAAIRKRFEEARAGTTPAPLAADPRLGRRRQATRLLDTLDSLCGDT